MKRFLILMLASICVLSTSVFNSQYRVTNFELRHNLYHEFPFALSTPLEEPRKLTCKEKILNRFYSLKNRLKRIWSC